MPVLLLATMSIMDGCWLMMARVSGGSGSKDAKSL